MKLADRESSRIYRQTARAAAAAETRRQVLRAFGECLRVQWFDEVMLAEVAKRAGVTSRTIIRRFGGKEGLLEAFVDDFIPAVAHRTSGAAGGRRDGGAAACGGL